MNKPPRILLGVSGGIAAYKAVEVLRELVTRGADVRVAMTRGSREFVAPLTFSVLSKHPVHTEVWEGAAAVDHVELAQGCDLLLVAPATAHTLGKLANGLADDFLSTYFLAHRGPVLLAPAMESAMWGHAAVRANMERLAERGARHGRAGRGVPRLGPRGRRAAWPSPRRSWRRPGAWPQASGGTSRGCGCS